MSPAAGRHSIRGGAFRGASYVFGLALGVLSAPLLIRHLGVAGYGRYATVLSVATIALGVTEAGIANLAVREHAVLAEERRLILLRHLLGLRLALGCLGVAVAVIFAWAAGYSSALVVGAFAAAVGLLLSNVQALASVPLQTQLRLVTVASLDLLRQTLTVVFIVVMVLLGFGIVPLLWVLAAAGAPVLFLTVHLASGRFSLWPSLDLAAWRTLALAAVPFAAVTILAIVYFRMGIIALSLISNAQETGYFATAFRVLEALIAVPGMVVATVFPILSHAAEHDHVRLRNAMSRVLAIAVAGGSALALLLLLAAPFLIDVLAGSGADPATPVMRIQAVALLPSAVGSACSYGLLSLRRQRAVLLSIFLGLVVNLTLIIVLVPGHGAVGAAVAVTVAEFVIATTALVALIRGGAAHPPATLLLPVGIAVVVGGLMAASGLPPVWQAVIAAPVYGATLLIVGAVPMEAIHALRRT